MTNYVIGLIGNKEGIVEFCNCFGEISTKVYSELYKTKHGRKEVAVKYYSIEDLISSTSNHIMKVGNTNRELISKDFDMSLSDLKNEIKESIDNSLWIKVLENLIKKDYKSNNPTYL